MAGANQSLSNNAKLRRGSGSFFHRKVEAPPTPGQYVDNATPATRKHLREKLRREQAQDRRRTALATAVGIITGLGVVWYLFFG